MSKLKLGDEVWVKAEVVGGTPDDPHVKIRGYCFLNTRLSCGAMEVTTVASPANVMKLPPVRTPPEGVPEKANKKVRVKK